MKLNIATDYVDSGNVQAAGKFTIKQSPLAFQILSSGLYSDKISAVIRELACNATDAHIAAGIPDEPIRVKLPNSTDRTFYVQDNGPGLTHDEICHPEHGLYTTYFSSSKNDDNSMTGAFGLGSKSPFAYTDQFTVETARDGEHRTYVCYRDAKGMLACDLMDTRSATDSWPHGLKVSMPVAKQDFKEFAQKAETIFRWFRITPNVTGGGERERFQRTIKAAVLGFEAAETLHEYSWNLNPMVVMGNVAYPINCNTLINKSQSSTERAMLQLVNQINLVFDVPIGTISITPSRESVEYTDATILNLTRHIRDLFKAGFQSLLLEARATNGTVSELAQLRQAYDNDHFAYWQPFSNHYVNNMKSYANWLSESLSHEDMARLDILLSDRFPLSTILDDGFKGTIGTLLWPFKNGNGDISARRMNVTHQYTVDDLSALAFYYADCKSARHIVAYHVRQRALDHVILIEDDVVYINLQNALRAPTIHLVSSLEKPPKPKRGPRKSAGPAKYRRGEGRSLPTYELDRDYAKEDIELNDGFTPPKLYLGDIPDDERYFITRTASYGRRSWHSYSNQTGVTNISGGGHWNYPVTLFEKLNAAHELMPELKLPRKVLVLTEAVREQLEGKDVQLTPVVDAINDAIKAIIKEASDIRSGWKQDAASKQLDYLSLLNDATIGNSPCDTHNGDVVFRFFRRMTTRPALRQPLTALLPATHPLLVLNDVIRAPVVNMPNSADFDTQSKRYDTLAAAYGHLTQFGYSWPSFGAMKSASNNNEAVFKAFDEFAKSNPDIAAALCVLDYAHSNGEGAAKALERREAEVLAALLS